MESQEYYFEEGCFITELHNTPVDRAVSIARARVRPGETTHWHSLKGIEERYLILAGTGLAEVGEAPPQPVSPGETVHIASGERQRIVNTGTEDLVFLAVCTPRFIPEAYTDLEADLNP